MSRNVLPKRHLSSTSSPTKLDQKERKVFITPNRYASLSVDEPPEVFSPPPIAETSSFQVLDTVTDTPATVYTKSNRSPPIFVKISSNNIPNLRIAITSILGSDGFSLKSTKDFLIIKTVDCTKYTEALKYLTTTDLDFHSFHLPSDTPIQAVIRHLHHSIAPTDIETALTDLGFSVISVRTIHNRFNKMPLSLFSVNLKPVEFSQNIFKLTKLLNFIITVEKPRKSFSPPQCLKCQQYGHTRHYCRHTPRCVKCSETHLTTDCTKSRELPAKCALCSGAHTANYKGCPAYKELINIQNKKRSSSKTTNNVVSKNALPVAPIVKAPVTQPSLKNKSYAEATKIEDNSSLTHISSILSNFISNLNSIISPLISLLTATLNSLLPKTI